MGSIHDGCRARRTRCRSVGARLPRTSVMHTSLARASRASRQPGDVLERTTGSHRPRLGPCQVTAGHRFRILHFDKEPGILLASSQPGEGEATFQLLALEPDRDVAVAQPRLE